MSVQKQQSQRDDSSSIEDAPLVERFYESATTFVQDQLDAANSVHTKDDGLVYVRLTDNCTSVADVDGFSIVAVTHSEHNTVVLFRESETQ